MLFSFLPNNPPQHKENQTVAFKVALTSFRKVKLIQAALTSVLRQYQDRYRKCEQSKGHTRHPIAPSTPPRNIGYTGKVHEARHADVNVAHPSGIEFGRLFLFCGWWFLYTCSCWRRAGDGLGVGFGHHGISITVNCRKMTRESLDE
jgi:hypothetical protein